MYCIIGDIHSTYDELMLLVDKLGFKGFEPHPLGYKLIFVGDLCDRGIKPCETLTYVMAQVKNGNALCILGNHCEKMLRGLKGNKITPSHGLAETLKELDKQPQSFRDEVRDFLANLPYELILDENRLSVSHAGLPEHLQGVNSPKARTHALYGDIVNGVKDSNGFPLRKDWAKDYKGSRIVVHGHVPLLTERCLNNVWNVDLGSCFGNYLCALSYPSMTITKVKALAEYVPYKPFHPNLNGVTTDGDPG